MHCANSARIPYAGFYQIRSQIMNALTAKTSSPLLQKSHNYPQISEVLVRGLDTVYRITSNLTDTRKIIILANVRYN